jgi:phytanoyl-CoA hydroxylase
MDNKMLHIQLQQDGYCVVPSVLDAVMLARLRARFSDAALAGTAKENFGDSGAFVVADYRDPVMVDLLTWPKTLHTLREFDFPAPKLHNFYVSTKPPQAKALGWHSDLFYRYDESAPAELFLIYYLQDTRPGNGCLRVAPGSHRWPHEKRHAQAENAQPRTDETDVRVQAGDLFIGDRCILHATHANASNTWRTCITIAYAPLFDQLAESIQALIIRNRCLPPAGWWSNPASNIDPRLAAILPIYEGAATPIRTRA